MWPQLELLKDFMRVGTIPTRWKIFPGENDVFDTQRYTYVRDVLKYKKERQKHKQKERQEEMKKRVNVALLQFINGRTTKTEPILDTQSLKQEAERVKHSNTQSHFSLFVVEDLSCDVIETLGSTFGIDPRFFRSHIIDYSWNNVRDRWREPPMLDLDARKRDWFQLRLICSRYFSNQEELGGARKEIDEWNVFRRIDVDNNEIFWDRDKRTDPKRIVNGRVGHIRSRITFWRASGIGVVILDPTLRSGHPLWRGYANWYPLPRFAPGQTPPKDYSHIPPSLRRQKSEQSSKESEHKSPSLFEDFTFWAQHTEVSQLSAGPLLYAKPLEAMLRLVCVEWLTFTDYINTRLNQIDWGIANPGFFPDSDSREQSLKKVHFWRRWIPQCANMFRGNMRQVFNLQKEKHDSEIFIPYKEDYESILDFLKSSEQRLTNLGSVVNSAISLEDARNTSKLTALAAA
ncbi:hypothetical protein F53441_14730, partial [Fusarium austroafricanum]